MYSFSPQRAEPGASPDRLSSIKKLNEKEESPEVFNFKQKTKSPHSKSRLSSSKKAIKRDNHQNSNVIYHSSTGTIFKND
jgi:hypothetical protein